MNEQEYNFVARLLLERSAIVLEPGKQYLLDARLTPVARKHGLASVDAFIAKLREPGSHGLQLELIEAMVTTETTFFRDLHPFETLRKTVLPELIAARSAVRELRIWCAASSSGQEPYSLAMLIRDSFPELRSWKVSLLATDLSQTMLNRCREGKFSQIEVNRGLPTPLLLKYFRQEGRDWFIDESLKSIMEFRQMNLAQAWPILPPMDLIFLRNVMIYFDVETKKAILNRVSRTLRPDGYLVLGGAETTFAIDDSFRRIEALKGGFYRRISEAA